MKTIGSIPPSAAPSRPDRPWLPAARAAAIALLALGTWFAAVRVAGAPEVATRHLLVSLAVAGALGATLHRPGLFDRAGFRAIAFALTALSPILLGLAADLVGLLPPLGGPIAEIALDVLWGGILLVPLWCLTRNRPRDRRGLGQAISAVAVALAAGLGLAALAIGAPPWVLSAAAAVGLFVPGTSPAQAKKAAGLSSLLGAAVAASWLLTVPPLLLAYAGAVPQGLACLVLSFVVGLGVGRLLLPPALRTVWAGSLAAALSGLLALAALGAHASVAQLALGAVGPTSPWVAIGLAVGGSAGLAASTARPDLSRPGFLAGGIVLGMAVVNATLLGAPPDLPVRGFVGVACLSALVGLTLDGIASTWTRRVAWCACIVPILAVGMLPPLQVHTASLGAALRVPARDLGLIEELLEAELLGSGPDRAGPRSTIRSSRGEYLLRAYDTWSPGEAERAAEIFHGLLPVLAAGHARRAAVIGLGRGDVLDPLGAANPETLYLLDRSPGAAAQIAALGGAPRDVITSPACQLVRSHPLPLLPLPRGTLDVVVVDLPPPFLPGAHAWFGRDFAVQISDSLRESGWTAFRVHSGFMDPGDLARVVVTFSTVFPDATVWVDPMGGGDVILLGSPGGGLPDGQRMIHGLTRRALRQALRAGDIQDPADLFCRAFSRADSEVYREMARSNRGMEWRAGSSRLRADAHVPLSALASAAHPLESLVDLARVPAEQLAELDGSSAPAMEFWPVYLQFLELLAQGDGAASMDQVEAVRQGSHDPTRDLTPLVHQIVEGGRTAAARGQAEDAHAMFLLAAAFSPDDPAVNVELGRNAWGTGNLREAIKRFERALAGDPDHLVALLGAADSHIRLGETGDALPHLERAARVHPDSPDALYNLGRLYVDLGRVEEGLEQYRRALPVQPENARVHFGIAEAHFRSAVGLRDRGESPHDELRLARQAADRSLSLERDALALCLKGQIDLVSGNYAAAEKALRESVELEPDEFESRAALGEAFFAQHEYVSALRQFREAARIRPADETVQGRLGQLERIGTDGS